MGLSLIGVIFIITKADLNLMSVYLHKIRINFKTGKINKYKSVNKEVLVVRSGVTYRVLDLGGSKIEVRVKSPKELARDSKEFKRYKNK